MKIHYFSGEAWEEEFVKTKLPNEEIIFHEGSLASFPDLSDQEAEVLCSFIESKIGEDEMKRFQALKLIATRSTGYDHIDIAAAKARGVAVANVPFYAHSHGASLMRTRACAMALFLQPGFAALTYRGKLSASSVADISAHMLSVWRMD